MVYGSSKHFKNDSCYIVWLLKQPAASLYTLVGGCGCGGGGGGGSGGCGGGGGGSLLFEDCVANNNKFSMV